MKRSVIILFLVLSVRSFSQVKHFMFIGMDREQLSNKAWQSNAFEGVQVVYSWRQLEPKKDAYDFSIIEEDLKLLKKYNKKLFIQIQDASFSVKWNNTPVYLLEDTIYHGGANKQYSFKDDSELEYKEQGWVTRRWDPAVQERLHKLYAALGKKFDGKIEGINTQETAVEFGEGPLHPPGFSFQRYANAIIENLAVLKKAFPKSTVIAYANFMPGGFLPFRDSVYMRSVYQFAWKNNIGVGGPDIFPYKRGQMNNSYGFIRDSYTKVPSGLAVQDGNCDYINPKTKKQVTVEDIIDFAQNYLHLTYLFWGTEEPYFHRDIIPYLEKLKN